MTKESQKIAVTIYGQSYTLLGEANPEYMLRLARYVDGKMREIGDANPSFDQLKIAILAAVNISNELLRLQDTAREQDRLLQEKSESLLQMLDKSLGL